MSKKIWVRAASILTAIVLMLGGIVFGPKLVQLRSVAASTSGMPVSHAGVDPNWRTIDGWQAIWQVPLDEESLYWVINRTGSLTGSQVVLWAAYDWSADMSTYSTRGVLRVAKTLDNGSGGTDLSGPVFSTSAMARIGGTKADPAAPLTVYFWDYEVQTTLGDLTCDSGFTPIIRATSEQENLEWSCLPTPYGTRYSAGGEADQYTGNIYMIPGGGSIDDQPGTSTNPSAETNWRFVVWDPVSGSYSLSYSVQPGDWEPGMTTVPQERIKLHAAGDGSGDYDAQASYDISLDSDGNAYTYSGVAPAAVGDGNMSIVRMEPARDADGNIIDGTPENPWRYYVVTKVAREDPTQTWSAPSSIYGNGIMNGQLILGSNTRVTATGLPTTATEGGRGTTAMVKIDPQSATASVVYSVGNQDLMTSVGYDNASSQGAEVLRGTLYQDVDGDGAISDSEPGLANQTVGLYNASGKLLSLQQTDSVGQYSFLIASVTGANTVFYIRPVEVTALLPDGVTRVNGAQTWGAGSVATGLSVNKVPLVNTAEIQCLHESGITSSDGGPCSGAAPTTAADPAAGALGTVSDPSTWHTYAKVTFNTGQYVPTADFGFTATGSFGDAPAGPLTSDVPMHANVPSRLWLGDTLGSYTGPASSTSAHPSDDGVWIDSYAGRLPLESAMLVSGYPYRLEADVNGPAASEAHVTGWVTRANTNQWDPSPRWTPSVADGTASGTFSLSALGSVQLRVDASDKAISLPTNVNKEYYGVDAWTTAGEIEDYGLTFVNAVIRPAAVTTKGEVSVSVAGRQIAASPSLSIGDAIEAADGDQFQVNVSVPDDKWTVTGVTINDTATGTVLQSPEFTPGPAVSFPYTPGTRSDVIVVATLAPSIDLEASTLTLDTDQAMVGEDITATATIIDSMGDPVPGITVSFDNASDETTLTGENGTKTCVTTDDGTCTVTITSQVVGVYPDEVSATINGEGFTGSPQSVEFTHGDQLVLDFTVTPPVDPLDEEKTDWRDADGTDAYQGVLTVTDQYGNPVADLDVADIGFIASTTDVRVSDVVNHHDGTYSVSYTSTTATSEAVATVFYQDELVGEPMPIPFKVGLFDASRSTFEVVPIGEETCVADGKPCYTGVLTAIDEHGNPLPGLDVADIEFSASSTEVDITDVVDNGDGTYTVTFSSTTASQDTTAAVTYQGTQVGTDEPIPFAPGDFDADVSTFTIGPAVDPADPDQDQWCAADGEACYAGVLTAMDANGNPIPDLTMDDIAFTASSGDVSVSSVEYTGNGTYTVRYSSHVGSARPTASVSYDGTQVGSDEPIPFGFGDFSAAGSTFAVTPQVDPADAGQAGWRGADGTDYYMGVLTAKDAHGTLLADLSLPDIEFASPSPDVAITDVTYTGNGTYSVRFTSTVGSSLPTASVSYDGVQVGSDEPIPYAHGEFSTSESVFRITPGVDPADPDQTDWRTADGTQSYMGVLTAKDGDGHLLAGLLLADLDFTASNPNVSVSSVTYLGGGMYMVHYTSTVGSAGLTAAVSYRNTPVGDPGPIPFITEVPHEVIPSVTAGPSRQTAGDPVTITVTVTDENGDPVTGLAEGDFEVTGTAEGLPDLVLSDFEETEPGVYTWTTTSTVVGEFEVTATVADVESVSTDVTFVAGAPDLMESSWVITPLGPLVVGTGDANTYTATATVLDRGGNPVQGVEVSFTVTGSGPVFIGGSSCETSADGVCQVRLSSTVTGTYPVTAVIDAGALTDQTTSQPAASVTWRADQGCVPAAGCAPDTLVPTDRRTHIEVTRDNQTANGTAQDIVTVHVFDRWGNPVMDAAVSDPSSGLGTVLTDRNGIATITYTSTIAGSQPTNVSVVGSPVTDVTLTFVPGPVCWTGCVPKGTGTDPQKQTRIVIVNNDALVNRTDSVAVYAFDEYGNPVEGQVFTFVTDDPDLRFGGSDQSSVTVVTDENGAGTWTVTSPVAGSHPVRVFIDGTEAPGSPLELRFVGPPTISGPTDGEELTTNEVTITGTGQTDGDTIHVTEDGIAICTAVVLDGTWSCQATMADGDHSLIAVEEAPDGSQSDPSNPVSFTIDTSAPATPSAPPNTVSPSPTPTGPTSAATGPASPSQTPHTPYSQASAAPSPGQHITAVSTGGAADESSRLIGLVTGLMVATIGLWIGVKVSRRQKEGGR